MLRYLIISILTFSSIIVNGQEFVIPLSGNKNQAKTVVTEDKFSYMRMHVNLSAIYGVQVTNNEGEQFTELYFGKGYKTGQLGDPQLPAISKLVQVPTGANISVRVMGYDVNDYVLKEYGISKPLFPMQPSLRKDEDIDKVPFYINKQAYLMSEFNNDPVASIEVLGTLRGTRIARLVVKPLKYNPKEAIIRVYNNIDIEIVMEGGSEQQEKEIAMKNYSPYFEPVHKKLLNSYSKTIYDERPDFTRYPIKMQIISHRMFEDTLQSFIKWKRLKGFTVDVAYTDEIGTSSEAIKSFMQNIYDNSSTTNPLPTFLVIVGDVQQVPASETGSSSRRKTDLYYASLDGDYFPEMYYGRLSAQTNKQLENIINKILYYEQYQFEEPEYLNRATLIAGSDATWNPRVGQPTVKYATKYYYNELHGINTTWGFGVSDDPNNPNSSSGYTGCYENEKISVGFINYTAHCDERVWDSPRLNIDAINSMSNLNKYPIAIGNCCLSADFGYSESIGEAWIRAKDKGAVTYIGSSPSTYWYEDFYWAVGAFPMVGSNNGYVPTREETTIGAFDAPHSSQYVTTGALVYVGNLSVTEANLNDYNAQSSPQYYWQAYNVLGDPSLVPYFSEAEDNNLSHPEFILVGQNNVNIKAKPGSYIAITEKGNPIGAAFVGESGEIDMEISVAENPTEWDLVITCPQTIPYFAVLPVLNSGSAYITLHEVNINDYNGNHDGQIDYGESVSLDITLKNAGNTSSSEITARIMGEDPYLTKRDSLAISFGNIDSADNSNTSTIENAFYFDVAQNVPDRYTAKFILQASDGINTWNSPLRLTANAPQIEITDIRIEDNGEGVAGILDPGETAILEFDITNSGRSNSPSFIARLSFDQNGITIMGGQEQIMNSILAGETRTLKYSIEADQDIALETKFIYVLTLEADNYIVEEEMSLVVGKLPEYLIGRKDTVYTCLGRFFDSGGGEANYSHRENLSIVFYPSSPGKFLTCDFEYAFIEGTSKDLWDKLYIYDGDSINAPSFPGSPFSNSNGVNIGTIKATNPKGALTFKFTSDASVALKGWSAVIRCEDFPVFKTTFFVNNSKQETINNATINIRGLSQYITNANGIVETELVNGDYVFTVNAQGYLDYESEFTVSGSDVEIPVNLLSTSIPIDYEDNLTVFPIPFDNTITIRGVLNATRIELYDILGTRLYNILLNGEVSTTLKTSNIPSGLYLIKVSTNNGRTIVQRIIKQ